jgi:hypothetical protein
LLFSVILNNYVLWKILVLLSLVMRVKIPIMRLQTAWIIILAFLPGPGQPAIENPYASIAEIPVPGGFQRIPAPQGSFAAWLRQLPLKKDKTVYLYNGVPKRNQSAQFAVIDISVGNTDLQQCADAVMRLRAEYLYSRGRLADIDFTDNNQTHYRLHPGAGRAAFDDYLKKVFTNCGTLSLSHQLRSKDMTLLAPGDVLVWGGSPGHAMLVMDVAVNKTGQKIYLLSQSYMPAQDVHVVINPQNPSLSPWYAAKDEADIETPEWTFKTSELKTWPFP